MALTTRLLFNSPTKPTHFLSRPIIPPCGSLPLLTRTSNIVTFAKRTRKFESRNKTNSTSTKEELLGDPTAEIGGELGAVDSGESFEGYVLPDLPGLEKDFWEGPEWDGFGFFIQYMWAFGIVFAVIYLFLCSCLVANSFMNFDDLKFLVCLNIDVIEIASFGG